MNSYLKFFLAAIASFSLGISTSILNEENSKSSDSNNKILSSNPSAVQRKHNNTLFLKLKRSALRFTTSKSQEELVSEIPYYELKIKIEEFDRKHRELVKEKLDPNDVYAKYNPNQSVVNDFVKEFMESKKAWLMKTVYLDKFKKDKVIIFLNVGRCKYDSRWIDLKSFENTHCFERDIFYNVGEKWTRSGRLGGVSWSEFYKNKPFFQIQLSDMKDLIKFRIIYLYAGLEDNNDEVFGLIFQNEKYLWAEFESTNWEEATELERKKMEDETSIKNE